jgi:hypothetical protein
MIKQVIPREVSSNTIGYKRQLSWMDRHGITKYTDRGKCPCVLGTRKQRHLQGYGSPICTCALSGETSIFIDHHALWIKNKVPYFFTTEPYSKSSPEYMFIWCGEHKMALFQHNSDVEGWHCAEAIKRDKWTSGLSLFVIMPEEYANTYEMIELNSQRIY